MSNQPQPQQTSQTLYPVLVNGYYQQSAQPNTKPENYNEKGSSSQANPQTHYIQTPVVLVQPINTNPQYDMKQPLLQNQTKEYPIYYPKGVMGYARKSRSNCCRVLCGITCCFCLLIFTVIGLAVGLVAWKCMQMDHSIVQVLTVDTANVTSFEFNAQHGTIYFSQSDDPTNNNVTITITRQASDDELFQTFSSTLQNSNGQVTFTDLSTANNWWNVVGQVCMKVDVSIVLPYSFGNAAQFIITTDNGDVVIAGLSWFVNDFSISTTNGDITVSGVSASSISARTTNGDVTAYNSTANNIILSTTNGDISMGTLSTSSGLSASSTNGDIQIYESVTCIPNGNTTNQNFNFETSNGDLELSFYGCYGSFHFSTTSGDVAVEANGANIQYTAQNEHQYEGYVGVPSPGMTRGTSTNGDVTAIFNF